MNPPLHPPSRVLLVDARPERRSLMKMVIESGTGGGTVVADADTGAAAVDVLTRTAVDAAVVEIQMPVDVGLAVVTALRAARPALTIVVCSFHADAPTRRLAEAAGADAYLIKPVSARQLQAACRSPGREGTAEPGPGRSGHLASPSR